METDNITITEEQPTVEETTVDASSPFVSPDGKSEVRLVDVEVTDDNIALNVMVSFLNIAQKRGVFNLDESSKIWECIKRFIQKA